MRNHVLSIVYELEEADTETFVGGLSYSKEFEEFQISSESYKKQSDSL